MLFAHPHTFIDVYPTITIVDAKGKNIHLKWSIDEMTSSMLIMDIDQDGNNKIDKEENTIAYKNYFSVYESYGLYTTIKLKDKVVALPKSTNFKASIVDGKLCFDFDLPLDFRAKDVTLDFGDSDFYVAMMLKKEFVNVKGAQAIVKGVDNDFYYGYRLELK